MLALRQRLISDHLDPASVLKKPALRAIANAIGQAPTIAEWSERYATCFTTRWVHGPVHAYVPPIAGYVLAATFIGDSPVVWRKGRSVLRGHARRGTITVISDGDDGYWDIPGEIDGMQMVISPGHIDAVADSVGRMHRVAAICSRVTCENPQMFDLFRLLSVRLGSGPRELDLCTDEILDRICLHLLGCQSVLSRCARLRDNQIKRIEDYLHRHLSEVIRLDDLARLVAMPRHQFSDAYRRATGMSPRARLTYLRAMRARELLAHSDRPPLAEVAAAVGYGSPSGLAKALKHVLGTTLKSIKIDP